MYMCRVAADLYLRYAADIGRSDIVSDIDSDLNPNIRVPGIVSDIDTYIGNVMPDIEVSNYDLRAPPILGAWCSDIGVYH